MTYESSTLSLSASPASSAIRACASRRSNAFIHRVFWGWNNWASWTLSKKNRSKHNLVASTCKLCMRKKRWIIAGENRTSYLIQWKLLLHPISGFSGYRLWGKCAKRSLTSIKNSLVAQDTLSVNIIEIFLTHHRHARMPRLPSMFARIPAAMS